jgi:predicted transcriptional regulator
MKITNYTQKDIADVLKITQPAVSQMMSKGSIKLNQMVLLNEVLKIPMKAWYDEDMQIKYFGKIYYTKEIK